MSATIIQFPGNRKASAPQPDQVDDPMLVYIEKIKLLRERQLAGIPLAPSGRHRRNTPRSGE